MTEPTIHVPEGYRTTHLRRLWALAGCRECGGNGEYPVSDDTDQPWDSNDSAVWYPQPCDCLWSPPPEDLRTLDAAHARLQRHRERMREVFDAIGPRRVGDTYWCGYWHRWYLVESIEIRFRDGDLTAPTWSITARWASGERGTHHTPWDPRCDSTSIPARLPGPAPAPPELRYPTTVFCRWCRSRFALVRAVHRAFCAR
ncbi:hypothetical protein H4696_000295 [Amycolatopsis lexingtonensis]|uniref:Uncharacterized protein n=1 Tax=Amycolatopsis lexingtonensis TaxID=218822 RepID=A0ABR9HQH9_9PSEU|nr:hypothetical protein [Amycolatopsis lexingtonensis]MBE1493195.1 hypothetical protein [Amycolatopsis lexingtonensis]